MVRPDLGMDPNHGADDDETHSVPELLTIGHSGWQSTYTEFFLM
jgi:hypothetical protein